MPTLQIRELPPEVYYRLVEEAQQAHRSLAQQAAVTLRRAQGEDTAARRRALVTRLRDSGRRLAAAAPAPETLIREDRDRP